MFTLPGLQLVRGMPLSSLLGWRWSWDLRHVGSSGSSHNLAQAAAALASSLPPSASAPAGLPSGSGGGGGSSNQLSMPRALSASLLQSMQPGALARQPSGVLARQPSGGSTQSLTPQPSMHGPHPCRIGTAAAAATRHGHIALLGPGAELVRLSLASDAEAAPEPPLSVYDWDLSAAAHAAASVMEQQQLQAWAAAAAAPVRRVSAPSNLEGALSSGLSVGSSQGLQSPLASVDESGGSISSTRREQPPAAGSNGSSSSLAPSNSSNSNSSKPADLKGFMTKIGADFHRAGGGMARGIQKALDETQKGLQKVAQVRGNTRTGVEKRDRRPWCQHITFAGAAWSCRWRQCAQGLPHCPPTKPTAV